MTSTQLSRNHDSPVNPEMYDNYICKEYMLIIADLQQIQNQDS